MLYPFCTCSIWDFHVGHHFDHSWLDQLSLTKSTTGSMMIFGRWLWMMIICGLSVSIRYIHALDDVLLWWLMLLLWLSTFIGFIIIIILTWMGPLLYFFYGHMVYGYSFLVDLDSLSPLVHSVFSFRHLYLIYGPVHHFAAVLPQ